MKWKWNLYKVVGFGLLPIAFVNPIVAAITQSHSLAIFISPITVMIMETCWFVLWMTKLKARYNGKQQ